MSLLATETTVGTIIEASGYPDISIPRDSAVIIGGSVGAAVLLCVIVISFLLRRRSCRQRPDARTRLDPFEYTQPTVSPVNRNNKPGIWGGQRGYDHRKNDDPGERSDSITLVGTGDLGTLSEIADTPNEQRKSDAAFDASFVDVSPEQNRLVISRHERLRALEKLYAAQSSGGKQRRTRSRRGMRIAEGEPMPVESMNAILIPTSLIGEKKS
ncbi:hypothetical protein EDC04DRAFT_2684113 [Pisolithus marmoratus]|nr:hypothetical protein EDC04DRAFT_2684113 [Pisolithus marmoratus]